MSDREQSKTGIRLIALMLIIGGTVGVVISLWLGGRVAREAPGYAPWVLLLLAVFVLVVWTGVALWQGKRWAFIWATILFAAQLPVFVVPALIYQFYTGVYFAILFDRARDAKFNFQFMFGTSLQLHFASSLDHAVLGLNIVPIFVLIYLYSARWPASERADAAMA